MARTALGPAGSGHALQAGAPRCLPHSPAVSRQAQSAQPPPSSCPGSLGWSALVRRLRDPLIDDFSADCQELVAADARLCGISARDFDIKDADLLANSSLLLGGGEDRRDFTVRRPDGSSVGVKFDVVPPSHGHLYQAKPHYMLSARADTLIEVGCYLQGASIPSPTWPSPCATGPVWWTRCNARGFPPSAATCSSSPVPQGGVSSVWLACRLRMRQIEATYCYGRLSFDNPSIASVDHHCWVEIGRPTDAGRQVIDLTCDQADGFGERVIYRRHGELARDGIHYEPVTRLAVDDLPDDRVWPRYQRLEESMRAKWGMRTLCDAV